MGCGSSRAVIVPSDCTIKNSTNSLKENGKNKKKIISVKSSRVSLRSDVNNNNVNSQGVSATDVDESLEKKREISASSSRTADSGISELPDENIITENSNPDRLTDVGASQRPETPGRNGYSYFANF